ncbi:MAG: hypothetical protein FWF84_06290, partial [Kiritimatiellaeota bacterium]|nr:hypothetical protein [Kiritimatiellota bacterium]
DFEYLGEASKKIARREALLGVSMTGMMEHPSVSFNPAFQQEVAKLILDVNADVAKRIGINPCARATCVKPAGTTSCILGTSSGIHPHHSRRYFRRAQANDDELMVDFYKAQNPLSVEKSVWNPNGTDVVITFCIQASEDAVVKRDVDAVGLLEYVKTTKKNWVDAGKRPGASAQPWLSHNVSNTISVGDDEWQAVERYIYENRDYFAGVSLLSDGGDLDYPQAPFCEVLTADEIVETYGVAAMFASGLIVDGMAAFNQDLWVACDASLGRARDNFDLPVAIPFGTHPVVAKALQEVHAAKRDWVRRAKKFAANYFAGDVLKMTRCLKRIHICKLWEDLNRTHIPVDYTLMTEFEDNTEQMEAGAACAGGKCDTLASSR